MSNHSNCPNLKKKHTFGQKDFDILHISYFFSTFAPKFDGMKKLIGREREIQELERCLTSNQSEFVIVYGRRRVGKTFLVDEYFRQTFDFSFVGGHNLSVKKQLRNFAKAIKRYANLPKQPKFEDWSEAFDALTELIESISEKRKKVIFIDEMPWIDTPHSDFVEEFENFWNGWAARRRDILLLASGSATSWMIDKLVDNQGGLHCRITSNIYLKPFTLQEVEQYLRIKKCTWDRYQIVQAYMILGGVPFYWSLLDTKLSLVQNIDRLFFHRNAILNIEFDELYNALFTNAERYVQIVQLLANHKEGLTRNQIGEYTKLDGRALTAILRNLERCDFILKYSQLGNKVKDAIYRLSDFYTLFYLKYVHANNSLDEQWWSKHYMTHSVEAWQGQTYELVCMLHTDAIKQTLGIAGIATDIASWRYVPTKTSGEKGAQIDMVISRADRVINLCEIKFAIGKYQLSKTYAEYLRDRIELFRAKTNTKYSIVQTMLTTYGMADSVNSGIVQQEVVMDDLFNQ